jgi:hypothetical protein
VPYTLKAAALAAGTLLATPYLAIYDMMVLAILVAFLVRIGLKTGFRGYELPALGGALVLIACYFTATPTGLAATLIVSILILVVPVRGGGVSRRQPWLRRAYRLLGAARDCHFHHGQRDRWRTWDVESRFLQEASRVPGWYGGFRYSALLGT